MRTVVLNLEEKTANSTEYGCIGKRDKAMSHTVCVHYEVDYE